MSPNDDVDGVTLGEVVRLLRALTEQVGALSREITHRFDDIDKVYVRREVYNQRLDALNERQTTWERSKDVFLLGLADEVQKVHRELAGVEQRALKEIEKVEDNRIEALEKVASQRHTDRMTYASALLLPLIVGVLLALATGTWQP